MEVPVEGLSELGHGWMLSKLYIVVEMEQESGSQVMGYNDLCLGVTRCICGLVSFRD